ncbi:ABC transporter substrate-binding protein [Microbacterium pumilum]|uniref:ABC transporter substrate-binding protein n=1 Tax=Microbacterium pumilum TaxID=344165 RepID=A0ABN2RP04_9MICO
MTKVSKGVIALAALAASALAITGCAGGGGSSATSSSAAWDGKQIASAVIALPAQTTSFNPTESASATDRVAAALMSSALYLQKEDGTVEPGLADGEAVFNDDLTEATVKLREATFSDGSPITANDVVATIQYEQSVPESVIASTTGKIKTVEAVDDGTVKFTFVSPYPSFEGVAGLLSIYPAAELADPDAYFKAPTVTSGQYTIKSGWASNKLELDANPEFWGGAPAIEHVTFQILADGNSALSQLQSGQVDFAGDLAPSYISQVEDTPGLRVEVSQVFGFFDLRLRNDHAPFDDANVRKAVNAAIDRTAIVSGIWGEYNAPQSGFWPAGMEGNDPDKSVEQDLDGAKELLAGTACESGCTVDMIYSDQDFAFSQQLALMVQEQLGKIGITLNLQNLDGATLIDRLFAGDFDLAPGAMTSGTNTPDQLLNLALNGNGPLSAEFTGYNSDEMNALIETAITNTAEKRTEAVEQIETLFSEDQSLVTIAPWVRGSATKLPEGVFSLVGASAIMATVK